MKTRSAPPRPRVFAAVAVAAALFCAPCLAGDPVVNYSAQNARMNAAIGAARATLDTAFWPVHADPRGAEMLAVKVEVPVDHPEMSSEYIWVSDVRRLGGGAMVGLLANDPNGFDGRVGDRLEFDQAQISDWTYMRDGKMHGAYTLRVILPRLDPREAAAYRATLAPLPE